MRTVKPWRIEIDKDRFDKLKSEERFWQLVALSLRLVERLRKHYHEVPKFEGLHQLLRDRAATELRNSSLATFRNRLTFHFEHCAGPLDCAPMYADLFGDYLA